MVLKNLRWIIHGIKFNAGEDDGGGGSSGNASGNSGGLNVDDTGNIGGSRVDDNLGSGSGDKPVTPLKTLWPETWREDYAKTDEKKLNRLKRFTSPDAALDWAFEADKTLSSRQIAPGNDATTDQVNSWKESLGIPKSSDGYLPHIKDLPILEDDQDLIKGFLDISHNSNLTPEQVSKTLSWFYSERDKNFSKFEEDIFNRDTADKQKFTEQLHAEWGPAYPRNLAAIDGFLKSAPNEIADVFENARLQDGSRVGSSPTVLNWLANLAMELNPASTVVSGVGPNAVGQIESEITTMEARMGGDQATRAAWFKDNKAQQRYTELVTARDTLKSRGK